MSTHSGQTTRLMALGVGSGGPSLISCSHKFPKAHFLPCLQLNNFICMACCLLLCNGISTKFTA